MWLRFFLPVYPPSVVFIAPSKNNCSSRLLLCEPHLPQKACCFWSCPHLRAIAHAQYIPWLLTSERLKNCNQKFLRYRIIDCWRDKCSFCKCYLKNPVKQQLKGYEVRITSCNDQKGNWINLDKRKLCLHGISVWRLYWCSWVQWSSLQNVFYNLVNVW